MESIDRFCRPSAYKNHSQYIFKPKAPLKHYLEVRQITLGSTFTLLQLSKLLWFIIKQNHMVDPKNPVIIVPDSDLGVALDQLALHRMELKGVIRKQLILAKCAIFLGIPLKQKSNGTSRILKTMCPISQFSGYTNSNEKFVLKPIFRSVLSTQEDFPHARNTFSYHEITNLVSKYLAFRGRWIFDSRNSKILVLTNDPLGLAFNVNFCHTCQATSFIRKQIVYFKE
jgi:hypothetical protein